jgi:two-component system CheB/CheR fusion protein
MVRYATAPVAAVFSALVQYLVLPQPSVAPFVFFYFGIALTAWIAGRGPGLLSVLLSALLASWMFLPPYWELSLSRADLTAMLLFAISAGSVALLCALFRDALLQARKTARRLRRQATLVDRAAGRARESERALREREEQLRRANERLQEADRRKDEFLGVLSHELRNPLAPIQNSLFIAARSPPGSEQTRRALAVIERQVAQLTRLVDDLLDVTRIARGKVRLQRKAVDLRALASRTAEDYQPLFAKHGLTLEVAIGDAPLSVSADPTRLTQIIGNLLHNAVKFTPPGARTTLSIRRADERSAEIAVEDTGHGIAPEVLTQLFRPFVQAETTLERSAGGLGLGLALVRGLAELHGGSVSAHSDGLGRGARFAVRIPLERRKAPRLAVVGADRPPSASARRVLVVEDNVDAAESLKEALELTDHDVELAFSGPEGIERARALRPDVVLCDIGLPGLNGFEVAKAIRADPALESTTLVALSGYALPEDVDRAKAAGFDLHVAKPPDLGALERSIAEARADREAG